MTVQALDRTSTASAVSRRRAGELAGRIGLHLFTAALALIFTAPFFFSISTSLKSVTELHVFPPVFWPADPQPYNYVRVFEVVPFGLFYLNTVIIAGTATIGNVLCAAVAAYGFARFRWRGREFCFLLLLSTLVLPEEVVIIPKFLMFHVVPEYLFGYSWINTWWPLILPSWIGGGAFNVFLLRQFFLQLPRDLDEAATIDGAGPFRILRSVILPLSIPAITAVSLFHFVFSWNDFFLPLLYLAGEPELQTLPIAIQQYNALYVSQPSLIQASALMTMAVPVI